MTFVRDDIYSVDYGSLIIKLEFYGLQIADGWRCIINQKNFFGMTVSLTYMQVISQEVNFIFFLLKAKLS